MSMARGGTGGVIINISSISGVYGGLPGDVVYAGTKGGLDSFTLGLAREVAGEGIRVCCIRPGLIKTEIWDDGMGQDEVAELGRRAVPLGRIGRSTTSQAPACGCAPKRRPMSQAPFSTSAEAAKPSCASADWPPLIVGRVPAGRSSRQVAEDTIPVRPMPRGRVEGHHPQGLSRMPASPPGP